MLYPFFKIKENMTIKTRVICVQVCDGGGVGGLSLGVMLKVMMILYNFKCTGMNHASGELLNRGRRNGEKHLL